MGAPPFAVPALLALREIDAQIVAVFTKAPRQGGRRGLERTKTAVHEAAERLGLRVETPPTLRGAEAQRVLAELRADIAIVAAYGLLLPSEALTSSRLGSFNLHASLLPRWRGAAPVQRSIMAQDHETGVSLMRMEVGLDTGPIAGELRTKIDPNETAAELTTRLSVLAARTLQENWDALVHERLMFDPQASTGVTYARKIEKSEAPIDWLKPAEVVRGHIHGLSPFPGAYSEVGSEILGERLKVLQAEVVEGRGRQGEVLDDQMTVACGENAVRLMRVQRAGRKAISGAELMRSGLLRIGDCLPSRAPAATS